MGGVDLLSEQTRRLELDGPSGSEDDHLTGLRVSPFPGPPEFYPEAAKAGDAYVFSPGQGLLDLFEEGIDDGSGPLPAQEGAVQFREQEELWAFSARFEPYILPHAPDNTVFVQGHRSTALLPP